MLARQFLRYFISGSTAVLVHLGVLVMLVEWLGVLPTVATGAGFVVAVLVNYLIQHYWVFAASGRHTVFLPRYLAVTAATFALNLALFWALVNLAGVWYPLAQVFCTGVIFLLNFAINRSYTFRAQAEG